MQTSHQDETTNDEILDAIKDFAEHVEDRFNRLESRQDRMELGQEQMKRHLFQSDERLDRIETTMVTNDYLDEKLFDLKGDLVVLARKEDVKITKLVDVLLHRKLIDQKEAEQILGSGPFPLDCISYSYRKALRGFNRAARIDG